MLAPDEHEIGSVALVGDTTYPFVLEADRVERIAVVLPGRTLTIVDANTLPTRFVATVDFSRRLFTPSLDDGDVNDAAVTDAVRLDESDYAAWRDRAHACIAAEMVGVSRRIFEMSLQYAKERYQFDVPIGSFQAIQHKLADMSLALERATAAVQYAAMTVDAADAQRHARARRPRPLPAKRRAAF